VPEDGNPESLSITHLEFRQAGQSGIPRIALLRPQQSQRGPFRRSRLRCIFRVRSFHARESSRRFLMKAGSFIVWLHLNVSGFRSVLARG
jgi:hypothetical protein